MVTLALLGSLCSALVVSSNTKVEAASQPAASLSSTRISPDLRQLLLSGQGDKRVKVIVQSVPSTTNGGLLDGLLNTVGGLRVNVLSALNIRIVDVRASDVEVLAADPSVAYISLDNPVRSAGHLTTTTGTQQIRTQKSLLGSSDLDGSGVTNAFLDSCIDSKNK
jgi:hypothetical protein